MAVLDPLHNLLPVWCISTHNRYVFPSRNSLPFDRDRYEPLGSCQLNPCQLARLKIPTYPSDSPYICDSQSFDKRPGCLVETLTDADGGLVINLIGYSVPGELLANHWRTAGER